jgi:radical SAM protein with 4Fe4S-binding SPASM domain
MKKEVTFLTDMDINKSILVSQLCSQFEKIKNEEEKKILSNIINNFKNNDFSLLSPQEIYFLNNHGSHLWADYLIFRYKFMNYPKKRVVDLFPNYLLIEPVSACNLRCIMCFQIDETFNNSKNFMGMMELELFKKIIDEAYEGGTKAITFASRGEPTLHPKFGEMLEYCAGKFLELKINTNGTRLNEKLAHQILESGVTDMVFSVDSYTKQEYESIRIKGIFNNVLRNIQKFQEIKEKFYPESACATRISGVKVNKEQNPKLFKEFWQQYVDHVVMVEMENRWDTYNNPKEIAGKNPCDYLWERMYIWYDGTCNPCDIDYKSELTVGTVKDQSISEIWNGEKFTKLRNLHKTGKRCSCYPCDRCPVGN